MARMRGIAVLAAVTLAVGGCGGVGGGDDDSGGGAAGKGAITTLGFSLPDEIATTRVETFKKAHPDIPVTITEGAFDEQQFLSAVASGNPPDLVYMNRKLIGTYAKQGSVLPLDDCIAKQGIDMAQYRPAAKDEVTLDGKVYGIPEFYSVRVVYMNEALLREAGLTPDDVNLADWAGLAGINAKLTKVEGGKLTRIGIDPKIPEFLPMWAKANGADLLSPDGKTAKLDDPKVAEALATGLSLIRDQGGWGKFKAFRDTFDFFGAQSPLAKNQIAVWPMEDWYLNVAGRETPKAELAVRPFVDRSGNPITFASGSAWVVPKGAKNPDAACTFAKTMTATDTWYAAAKVRADKRAAEKTPFTGLYTGNIEADKRIFAELYKPSGNQRFDDAVQTILSVQDKGFSLPASPAGAEFDKAWYDAANRALSGGGDGSAELARGQQEASAALSRAAG
ncbi:extracellular solute-binding protein [Asanoa sp. WMMD1127]|uniref:extracellular solute-binding protein n=1 Tax=Asanoa sp. WMMD1127 TaxID=3016107 RepID=UPI0024163869|nr:extracellular solute-binding protein [Asanoa sp. WMMD1127]MDG4824843.1 extracellular solute-binding protein [Asanoa sp. WMMD1127]